MNLNENKMNLEVENVTLKHKNRGLKRWLISSAIAFLLIGWAAGTLLPIQELRYLASSEELSSSDKIDAILDIMSENWFFAADSENPRERFIDQAISGMTENEEDPHTAYLSAEETEAFVQSINRNFVGIGVQYTSTEDGLHIVQRVIKNSPAEKSGVMSGDIIHSVDGVSVNGLSNQEISERVRGEEGTQVTIDFIREGKTITLNITRAEIHSTTNDKILSDHVGYLQIEQFGESTGEEVLSSVQTMKEQGVSKLIIDLRDNGGGYLSALQEVASVFIPSDTTVMRQEYSDGSTTDIVTFDGMVEGIGPIVILVNENTASAAEVFSLAMKELRDDVTLVGVKTFGKGTVQITESFDDGSSLKYTTSKWISPSGEWVNQKGIEPDVEVRLHEVLYSTFEPMEEGQELRVDMVSPAVKEMQLALDYLGYAIDRKDGYFSVQSMQALQSFMHDEGLEMQDFMSRELYGSLISSVLRKWQFGGENDIQLQKAQEIINE